MEEEHGGGALELVAAENILNMNIRLYHGDAISAEYYNLSGEREDRPTIGIHYNGINHYQAVKIVSDGSPEFVNVAGDGHCFFHAILQAVRIAGVELRGINLNDDETQNVVLLRNTIADSMYSDGNLRDNFRQELLAALLASDQQLADVTRTLGGFSERVIALRNDLNREYSNDSALISYILMSISKEPQSSILTPIKKGAQPSALGEDQTIEDDIIPLKTQAKKRTRGRKNETNLEFIQALQKRLADLKEGMEEETDEHKMVTSSAIKLAQKGKTLDKRELSLIEEMVENMEKKAAVNSKLTKGKPGVVPGGGKTAEKRPRGPSNNREEKRARIEPSGLSKHLEFNLPSDSDGDDKENNEAGEIPVTPAVNYRYNLRPETGKKIKNTPFIKMVPRGDLYLDSSNPRRTERRVTKDQRVHFDGAILELPSPDAAGFASNNGNDGRAIKSPSELDMSITINQKYVDVHNSQPMVDNNGRHPTTPSSVQKHALSSLESSAVRDDITPLKARRKSGEQRQRDSLVPLPPVSLTDSSMTSSSSKSNWGEEIAGAENQASPSTTSSSSSPSTASRQDAVVTSPMTSSSSRGAPDSERTAVAPERQDGEKVGDESTKTVSEADDVESSKKRRMEKNSETIDNRKSNEGEEITGAENQVSPSTTSSSSSPGTASRQDAAVTSPMTSSSSSGVLGSEQTIVAPAIPTITQTPMVSKSVEKSEGKRKRQDGEKGSDESIDNRKSNEEEEITSAENQASPSTTSSSSSSGTASQNDAAVTSPMTSSSSSGATVSEQTAVKKHGKAKKKINPKNKSKQRKEITGAENPASSSTTSSSSSSGTASQQDAAVTSPMTSPSSSDATGSERTTAAPAPSASGTTLQATLAAIGVNYNGHSFAQGPLVHVVSITGVSEILAQYGLHYNGKELIDTNSGVGVKLKLAMMREKK